MRNKKNHGAQNVTGTTRAPQTVASDNTRNSPRAPERLPQTISASPSRASQALNVARNMSGTVDAMANAAQAGASLRRGNLGAAAVGLGLAGAALVGGRKASQAARTVTNSAPDAARAVGSRVTRGANNGQRNMDEFARKNEAAVATNLGRPLPTSPFETPRGRYTKSASSIEFDARNSRRPDLSRMDPERIESISMRENANIGEARYREASAARNTARNNHRAALRNNPGKTGSSADRGALRQAESKAEKAQSRAFEEMSRRDMSAANADIEFKKSRPKIVQRAVRRNRGG